MKKPLILLVDDDRAVLEALEAELRPAFEEICRIESFDDPREVLASLPRWTDEQRPIAVAIVDQKMPRMSGVDLLVRLREAARGAVVAEGYPSRTAQPSGGQAKQSVIGTPGTVAGGEGPAGPFRPTAHLHPILLTGYAGLDSALTAKNVAGTSRYVEKPWPPEGLHGTIRTLLARHLSETGADVHFLFREVVTEAEVRESLRVRFKVYARTHGIEHVLPQEAEACLDVDAYDAMSRHLGLFRAGSGTIRLVGTLRVAGETPGPTRAVIAAIVAPHASLAERFAAPRLYPLPMMTYLVNRDAVAAIVAQVREGGEQIVEPGRLTLRPEFRADSSGSQHHLARHMIAGAVSFFFFFRIEHALLTCIPSHVAFYRPYGFRDAEGTRTQFQPGLQCDLACLHGRIGWAQRPSRIASALPRRLSPAPSASAGRCCPSSSPTCLVPSVPTPARPCATPITCSS